MIEKKAFGKTGHFSTRTIFGGASMGRDGLSEAESDKTLDLLLHYRPLFGGRRRCALKKSSEAFKSIDLIQNKISKVL